MNVVTRLSTKLRLGSFVLRGVLSLTLQPFTYGMTTQISSSRIRLQKYVRSMYNDASYWHTTRKITYFWTSFLVSCIPTWTACHPGALQSLSLLELDVHVCYLMQIDCGIMRKTLQMWRMLRCYDLNTTSCWKRSSFVTWSCSAASRLNACRWASKIKA